MIWYQATVLAGSTSVIFRKWDAGHFIRQTERHGISSVFMVPVQVRDLIRSDAFDARRLLSLKNIGAGGALTPEGLIAECRDALPDCDYTDHYGQSETGLLTILKPWESAAHKGSIGRAAVGVDLRLPALAALVRLALDSRLLSRLLSRIRPRQERAARQRVAGVLGRGRG